MKTSHCSRPSFVNAIGIEAEDRRAAAELAGDFGEQFRILHRGRVDADFFRAGLDEPRRIVERADAAADGQRHEALLDDFGNQVGHDVAALVAGGDVVEDQFIRAVSLITLCLLYRIARIDMIEELDPFDHAAAVDVEAGDDSSGEHGEKLPVVSCQLPVQDGCIHWQLATDNWQLL